MNRSNGSTLKKKLVHKTPFYPSQKEDIAQERQDSEEVIEWYLVDTECVEDD